MSGFGAGWTEGAGGTARLRTGIGIWRELRPPRRGVARGGLSASFAKVVLDTEQMALVDALTISFVTCWSLSYLFGAILVYSGFSVDDSACRKTSCVASSARSGG